MKKIFIIIGLLFFTVSGYSEMEKSARTLGMGGAAVVIDDISAIFYNPAAVSKVKKYGFSASFMPVYSIENFYYTRLTGVITLNKFNISLAGYRIWLGSLFAKNNFYLGTAFNLSDKISFGAAFKYGLFIVEKSSGEINDINNSTSYLTLNIGAKVKIVKYFEAGISGENLTNPQMSFLENNISQQNTRNFIIGGKINFTDYFYITIDDKFYNSKTELKAGSELWVYNTVAVRVGINDKEQYSMGIGLKTGFLNFDFGIQSHSYLGNLYQLDLILRN